MTLKLLVQIYYVICIYILAIAIISGIVLFGEFRWALILNYIADVCLYFWFFRYGQWEKLVKMFEKLFKPKNNV